MTEESGRTASPAVDGGSLFLLGEIHAKVSTLVEAHRAHREDIKELSADVNERIDKHDERITKVERSQWKLAGIASIIPMVIAAVALFVNITKG